MTTKQQHPYAEILRAIADGEIIQLKTTYGDWADIRDSYAMLCMGVNCELRIKPRTIKIGEYEVPEPLREEPPIGTMVYSASAVGLDYYGCTTWGDEDWQVDLLNRGVFHLDMDSAILHAKALISLSEKK